MKKNLKDIETHKTQIMLLWAGKRGTNDKNEKAVKEQ